MAVSLSNGAASEKPIEVAFPLPKAARTNVHIQLSDQTRSLLLFLTTATPESTSSASLGSFVYALPNNVAPSETFSTSLYTQSETLDFTTRMAKVLARKIKKPVYVGNSMSFASTGLGGTVEEEMEGFKKVVEVVMGLLDPAKEGEGTENNVT